MQHIVMVNPVSGKEDCREKVKRMLADNSGGQEIQVVVTEYKGHATEWVRALGQRGEAARIYSCGGDGTLNEVMTGAYGFENLEVGCIPFGSGNDFIKNFGTAEEFLNLKDYLEGSVVDIDLMGVNGDLCLAISSIGLDSDVAYDIPKFRRLPFVKNMAGAYNLSILYNLLKPLGKKLQIFAEGRERQGEFLLIAACNGRTYGGGFLASPDASLQDGKMKVVLVKKISRTRIAGVIALYKKGRHVENGHVIKKLEKYMEYFETDSFRVTAPEKYVVNLDGESVMLQDITFSILPQKGRFVLPKAVYQRYTTQEK